MQVKGGVNRLKLKLTVLTKDEMEMTNIIFIFHQIIAIKICEWKITAIFKHNPIYGHTQVE